MPSTEDPTANTPPEPQGRAGPPVDEDHSAARRPTWKLGLVVVAAVGTFAAFAARGRPGIGAATALLVAAFVSSVFTQASFRDQRKVREMSDERAVNLEMRARSFSWVVTLAVLSMAWAWHATEYGARAAEPYTYLISAMVVSYTGAWLWLRRRS